jgi:hypothetical protein
METVCETGTYLMETVCETGTPQQDLAEVSSRKPSPCISPPPRLHKTQLTYIKGIAQQNSWRLN